MSKNLHYSVHKCRRLDSVTVTFPRCGHSCMEYDCNMDLIPEKVIWAQPIQSNSMWLNLVQKMVRFLLKNSLLQDQAGNPYDIK